MFADKILLTLQNHKITNALIKKAKLIVQPSMRKLGLCLITNCFIKHFKVIINVFFFLILQAQFLLFDIRMTQELSKGEIGNEK